MAPKWCFALRNGIRTTVISRLEPPKDAGALDGEVSGLDESRGRL